MECKYVIHQIAYFPSWTKPVNTFKATMSPRSLKRQERIFAIEIDNSTTRKSTIVSARQNWERYYCPRWIWIVESGGIWTRICVNRTWSIARSWWIPWWRSWTRWITVCRIFSSFSRTSPRTRTGRSRNSSSWSSVCNARTIRSRS